jgi:hypothetical protein
MITAGSQVSKGGFDLQGAAGRTVVGLAGAAGVAAAGMQH